MELYEYCGKLYRRNVTPDTFNEKSIYYGYYEWTPVKKTIFGFYRKIGSPFLLDSFGFKEVNK